MHRRRARARGRGANARIESIADMNTMLEVLLVALAVLPSHGTEDDHGGWGSTNISTSTRGSAEIESRACNCRRVRLDELLQVSKSLKTATMISSCVAGGRSSGVCLRIERLIY